MINLPAGSGRQPLLLDLLEEKQQRPVSDSELMHRRLLPPSFPSELVLWLLIPLLQNKSVGLHRISLPSFSLFLLSSCVNSTFTFHASSGSFSFTLSVAQFSRSAWCFPVACSGDINSVVTCHGQRADVCSSLKSLLVCWKATQLLSQSLLNHLRVTGAAEKLKCPRANVMN